MPIVKTDTAYWTGPEYKRQVRYTAKDGFTCVLPPVVAEKLGYTIAKGKTCDECVSNWEYAVKLWSKSNTTLKKIILYRVQRNAYITTRPDVPVDGDSHLNWKCTMSQEDIAFCEGMALAITAGVFNEEEITLDGDVRYNYKLIRDQLPDSIENAAGKFEYSRAIGESIQRMEWTPEREEFFRKIAHGMEAIILMFEKLQDNEVTKQIADSGGSAFGLLAAPAKES